MLGWGGSARAQETNLALYEAVALQCLATVPDTARAFVLEAPETMPYLRTALVNRWQAEGRTVFLPGAPGAGGLPGLRYTVETARVTYQKANGGRLARSVTLALRYTFSGADGRLLREARCQDTRTDVIPHEALPRVETEAFPETRAEPPAPGWLRRYLEPVVITAATAVGIYLFFTLRSERADDGG